MKRGRKRIPESELSERCPCGVEMERLSWNLWILTATLDWFLKCHKNRESSEWVGPSLEFWIITLSNIHTSTVLLIVLFYFYLFSLLLPLASWLVNDFDGLIFFICSYYDYVYAQLLLNLRESSYHIYYFLRGIRT